MEKMIWTRPQAVAEQFAANEYVAACSDLVNEYYAFVCDATGGILGLVYEETNGREGLQMFGGDDFLGRYASCGATHYVAADDIDSNTDFVNGYYLTGADGNELATPDVIWKGEDGRNIHCTKALRHEIDVVTGNKS